MVLIFSLGLFSTQWLPRATSQWLLQFAAYDKERLSTMDLDKIYEQIGN